MKALLNWMAFYPNRLRDAKNYQRYQYYREQLWPTPCQHKKTVLVKANIKTLTITRECCYCGEILVRDCKIN
jgi:hypothetical protein